MKLLTPFERVFDLFFPHLCLCCQRVLTSYHQHFCLTCQMSLPYTSLHEEQENLFTQRFWGRVKIEAGAACFYFVKGGKVQEMIHQLKYEKKRDIGIQFGRIYGRKLLKHPVFSQVDIIVPVPLHWKKEHIRGYNQAACISRGLSEVLEKRHAPKALLRKEFSNSQTKKSREERLNNVLDVFEVKERKRLENKHILLVDDVMTSGATLEACALPILQLKNTKVSMLTLAIAT